VAERKPFLLRIDSTVLDAVQRWANDDLRSLNAQIEFVLRDALRRTGRLSRQPDSQKPSAPEETAKTAQDREGREEDDG
jgi:hypothetical protein